MHARVVIIRDVQSYPRQEPFADLPWRHPEPAVVLARYFFFIYYYILLFVSYILLRNTTCKIMRLPPDIQYTVGTRLTRCCTSEAKEYSGDPSIRVIQKTNKLIIRLDILFKNVRVYTIFLYVRLIFFLN